MLTLDRPNLGWLRSPLLAAVIVGACGAGYGIALALGLSPLYLIAAPILLALLVVACLRPDLATVGLIVIEWGYLSDIAGQYHGFPSISKPLAVLLIVVLLARRFSTRQQKLIHDPTIWWMVGYLMLSALGLWYAYEPDRTMDTVVTVSKQILLFLVIVNLIQEAKSFRLLAWLLLILGALLGTLTVYQELTFSYDNHFGGLARMEIAGIAEGFEMRPRAGGSTSSPLAYGQQLIVLVPIGLWGILHGRGLPQRGLALYCTAACLAGIGLCFSRSTYVATAAMLGLYVLHLRLNPKYLLAVVPLVLVLLAASPPEFRARVGTLANLLPGQDSEGVRSEGSFNQRSVEMLMAVNMFVDHPILGVGGRNYPALYQQYIRETGFTVQDHARTPHSYFLEIAAEHGALGLIVWGGVVFMGWRSQREARRNFVAAGDHRMAELTAAIEYGYIGYLFTALFFHAAYPHFFWLQISWSAALLAISHRAPRAKQEAPQVAAL